jgi:hypothetical protein
MPFHKGREVENNAVDYGDGTVMIQYKDNGDIAIVPKSEITQEADQK